MAFQLHDQFRAAGLQSVFLAIFKGGNINSFPFGSRNKNLRKDSPQNSNEVLAISHEFPRCSYNSLRLNLLE